MRFVHAKRVSLHLQLYLEYAAVVCTAVIDLHTLGPRDTACTAVGILRYVNYGMSYVHAQP